MLILVLTHLWVQTVSPEADMQTRLETALTGMVQDTEPGFAVGVVRDGELIAETYTGLANLDHEAPIDQDTRFYIGSVSKQFTAALVLQLVLEQRVVLDHSIRRYVPDLPTAYEAVTVADCLYHTGGIREYTSLLLIRGDDRALQDRMDQDDALHLIRSQTGLDFEPGTQQRYSSSGYVLLTALLENLEGASLSDIAQTRLFDPLGMADTLFEDDSSAVIANRATSYRWQNDTWNRWLKHFDVVGDGGVLITLADMAKWDAELSSGAVFGQEWHTLMRARGRLRTGQTLPYGGGLWFGTRFGEAFEFHGGGLGGFITDQIRFPEQDLSIYVLANRNDSVAFQGWRLAEQLLDHSAPDLTAPPLDLETTRFEHASTWVGAYFADAINNRHFLHLNEAGGLDLHDGGDQFMTHLLPRSNHQLESPDGRITLTLEGQGADRSFTLQTARTRYTAQAYDNTPPDQLEELGAYTGWYCSAELETQIGFFIENQQFFQRYAQGQPEQLYPEPDNPNAGWNGDRRVWTGVTMVRFDTQEHQPAHQVVIGDLRVSGVVFERCDSPR